MFKNLQLDKCELKFIEWISPLENDSLCSYALRIAEQIDASIPFSLIGVSFGGMCAVEIAKVLKPENTIIISSAKVEKEIPFYIRIFRYFPLHKILPESFLVKISILIKHIVGLRNGGDSKFFTDMLLTRPQGFIKGAINCIVNWRNRDYPQGLIPIHGDNDHVLPFYFIKNPIRIKGGNHFMVVYKSTEINKILNEVFR